MSRFKAGVVKTLTVSPFVLLFGFLTGMVNISNGQVAKGQGENYQLSTETPRYALNMPFTIVPLFNSSTPLEPATTVDTETALITRVGDRVRDRHARESQFSAYDHYLSFYWEDRTVSIEIVDRVAKGGSGITINTTSLTPLGTRDFRAFFRGINTPAEYWHNVGMQPAGTNQYTTTITFNAKEGRGVQIGDRMEFEFSPFLQNPTNGRSNYYGTAFLYIVGTGIVPWEAQGPLQDSFPLDSDALLGGGTTLHYQYSAEPDNLLKQMSTNTAPINAQPFVLGRRLHHTNFETGAHSEQPNPDFLAHAGKLGPGYIAESCVACHKNNGRSFAPAAGLPLSGAVVRVGSDANGSPHRTLGSVLQSQSTVGNSEGTVEIENYEITNGQYADGTPYTLRKPNYVFSGTTPSHFSVRQAQPLIGMGLLEAITESSVLALADPDDIDGDGISGRARTVIDPETRQLRLGRFNHRAGQAKVLHQIVAALKTDMGVTTDISNLADKNPNAGELDDQNLDYLTRYIALLGVGARRDLSDADTQIGEQLFLSIGCADCHVDTFTTSEFHPMTELRSQTIHPYTDLLLHDLGPGLADNMGESTVSGSEWRTAPLWNIGHTAGSGGAEGYLHDGRARNLAEAILWHGGEADDSKEIFRNLTAPHRDALIKFLKSL